MMVGLLVGTLVAAAGVPAVTQPVRDRMIKPIKSGRVSFLIIFSSLDLG
jgi:hypothetical protein